MKFIQGKSLKSITKIILILMIVAIYVSSIFVQLRHNALSLYNNGAEAMNSLLFWQALILFSLLFIYVFIFQTDYDKFIGNIWLAFILVIVIELLCSYFDYVVVSFIKMFWVLLFPIVMVFDFSFMGLCKYFSTEQYLFFKVLFFSLLYGRNLYLRKREAL